MRATGTTIRKQTTKIEIMTEEEKVKKMADLIDKLYPDLPCVFIYVGDDKSTIGMVMNISFEYADIILKKAIDINGNSACTILRKKI